MNHGWRWAETGQSGTEEVWLPEPNAPRGAPRPSSDLTPDKRWNFPSLQYDNTISFENFLRGILQLISDEFGDDDGDNGDEYVVLTETGEAPPDGAKRSGSVPTTPGGTASGGSPGAAGQPGTPGRVWGASASGMGGAAAPANVA